MHFLSDRAMRSAIWDNEVCFMRDISQQHHGCGASQVSDFLLLWNDCNSWCCPSSEKTQTTVPSANHFKPRRGSSMWQKLSFWSRLDAWSSFHPSSNLLLACGSQKELQVHTLMNSRYRVPKEVCVHLNNSLTAVTHKQIILWSAAEVP